MLFLGICCFAQNGDSIIDNLNLREDVTILNHKILNLIKKDNFLSELQGLKIYHVFWLYSEDEDKLRKENFLNHSFLSNLKPSFFSQKSWFVNKKYLQTDAYISDSSGKLIAKTDGRIIYYTAKYKKNHFQNDTELINMFYKNEIDFVFYMGYIGDTYIGIKGKDLFVLKASNNAVKIYPLEEFVNCCWDKLFHKYRSN